MLRDRKFLLCFQKDDSIRELTDRLFFGTGRFQEYLKEKATPRANKYVSSREMDTRNNQAR